MNSIKTYVNSLGRGARTTVIALAVVFVSAGIAQAATTISTNILTNGTLGATGVSTFGGSASTTISAAGVLTAPSAIINGTLASLGASSFGATATSSFTSAGVLTLQNGETISNATDNVITLTAATTSLSGALRLTGTTAGYNALATIGTVVTDTGADISANTGRMAGLQINLASSGATVTGFRGIDSRVTDSGTAASTVGVQGFATHLANVSTGELWGGNMIAKLTAGGVENLYGGVNEARVVAGALGTGTHNYVTGGLNIYDVSGTATFGTETVKAASIGVLIGNNSNSASKTKATGAFVAIIGGDTVLTTGGAAFKVLNHAFSFPSKFDYGLDLYSAEASAAVNSFAVSDIRMNFGDTISNTAASTTVMSGAFRAASLNFASATAVAGTGDAITIDFTPDFPALAAGEEVTFISEAANTTAVTLAIDGGTAKAITKTGGAFAALVANDIKSGQVVKVVYDGTRWEMISPLGQ